jgi:hypothetical protein
VPSSGALAGPGEGSPRAAEVWIGPDLSRCRRHCLPASNAPRTSMHPRVSPPSRCGMPLHEPVRLADRRRGAIVVLTSRARMPRSLSPGRRACQRASSSLDLNRKRSIRPRPPSPMTSREMADPERWAPTRADRTGPPDVAQELRVLGTAPLGGDQSDQNPEVHRSIRRTSAATSLRSIYLPPQRATGVVDGVD